MPLNVITGFSEVPSKRMFGEVNEKQAEHRQTSWPWFHLPNAIGSALALQVGTIWLDVPK
jgi:hypothetical protein